MALQAGPQSDSCETRGGRYCKQNRRRYTPLSATRQEHCRLGHILQIIPQGLFDAALLEVDVYFGVSSLSLRHQLQNPGKSFT